MYAFGQYENPDQHGLTINLTDGAISVTIYQDTQVVVVGRYWV